MAMQWFARLGALGLGLLIATPISAQTTEPTARTAAAFADYHKACGPLIEPYIEFYVNQPKSYFRKTRQEATDAVEYDFRDTREVSSSTNPAGQYGLLGVQGLRQRVINATGEDAQYHNAPHHLGKCSAEVALRHALQGVPGYDYGVGSKTPPATVPPSSTPKN